MNAIILCAGEGVRMKPITDHVPKPLLPIANHTLLDIHISELQKYAINCIGINLFHKAESLQAYISNQSYEGVTILTAIEPVLFGTGGALKNFPQFNNENTLVVSCDSLGNRDIGELIAFHRSQKACATLLLSNKNTQRIVEIDKDYHVKSINAQSKADEFYDFTGTAVYSKEVFSYLPKKNTFSFIDLIAHLQEQGKAIYGYPTSMGWYNINTIEAYFKIHEDILCKGIKVKGIQTSGCFCIDPSSNVETAHLDGFIAIGADCTIGHNVTMYNTVVFAGSTIEQGEYSNCIVSDTFHINVSNLVTRTGNGI